MYRRYIRELINTRTLQGYFQGPDDLVGFSPLLKDQASTKAKMINRPQISMEQIVPTKLSYIRRFLSLAETLTNQVIVISSPDITRVNDNRDRFDILLEQLKYEFPFIKVLRQPDYNLRYNHFSNDGFYHLNVDGADFFTEKVLAKSGIKEHPDYDSRLNRIQRQIDIRPPLQDDQQIANSGSLSFDADANDILYQSRRIKVQGSGDLVLNVEFSLDEGVVYACIQGFDQEEVTGGLKSEYCGFVDSKKPDYPALARHSAEWPWISVQIRVPKPSRGTIKSISLFQEIPAD